MKKILPFILSIMLLFASICMAASLGNQETNTISPLTPPEINAFPSSITTGVVYLSNDSVQVELSISNIAIGPQAENLEWDIETQYLDSLFYINFSPDSGTVHPGQTDTVLVTFFVDPMIPGGTYCADIIIHNNALPSGVSDITVPVTFYYTDECGGLEGSVTYGGWGLEGVLVMCGSFQTYTTGNGFSFNDQNIPSGCYDVCFYYEGDLLDCFCGVYLNPGWIILLNFEIPLYLPPPENFTATAYDSSIHLEWGPPQSRGGGAQVDYVLDDGTDGEYNVSYITLTSEPEYSSKDLPDPIHDGYLLNRNDGGFSHYIASTYVHSYDDYMVSHGVEYTYTLYATYDLGISSPVTASAIIPVGADDLLLNYETALYDNFPNPVLNNTTFEFSLKEPSHVTLSVYNLKGQLVSTLLDEELDPSASHCIEWDSTANGKKLANGIYFYKLVIGKKSFLKKMVLMR